MRAARPLAGSRGRRPDPSKAARRPKGRAPAAAAARTPVACGYDSTSRHGPFGSGWAALPLASFTNHLRPTAHVSHGAGQKIEGRIWGFGARDRKSVV